MIKVYPVIHQQSVEQASEQADLAFELGADGVYLIDHETYGNDELLTAYNAIRMNHPDEFIGLNLLSASSGYRALKIIDDAFDQGKIGTLPSGLWVDDVIPDKEKFVNFRSENPEFKKILYLGGVAFKYTQSYTDLAEKAAQEAVRQVHFTDVVTTSGAGTGQAPSKDKIKAMKLVIGDNEIAIASGVDVENVNDYRSLADSILVASSVETEPYSGIFDRKKLEALIVKAHR